MRNFLNHEEQFFYAVFSDVFENDDMMKIINVVKHDVQINSNNDNEIVFFRCYFKYANVFNEINAENLSKRNFHDHVIETMLSREFFFEFIYNFS